MGKANDAGLFLTADGSGDFNKALQQLERVVLRLDSAFSKIVSSSDKAFKGLTHVEKSTKDVSTGFQKMVQWGEEANDTIKKLGGNIPGLIKAIQTGFKGGGMSSFFEEQGSELGRRFVDGIEGALGISSPSRVMRKIGEDTARGFQLGFTAIDLASKGVNIAKEFILGFANAAVTGLKNALNGLKTVVYDTMKGVETALNNSVESMRQRAASLIQGGLTTIAAGGIAAFLQSQVIKVPVDSAIAFDRTMTNVFTVIGATTDEMALLNAQILDLGADSVAGSQAVADAFYDIVGGVTDATQRMPILEAAIATSEAGQADLASATQGLISVMNSYGSEAITSARASDVFTRTVGTGVGTMNQFVSAMSPVAGLSAQLGISFESLGSAAAFLTTKGSTPAMAMTRLQAAMVALLKPNKDMEAALKRAGYASGELAIKQLGLSGALDAVSGSLGNDTGKLAAALGSTEALQAAVVLLDDSYASFQDEYNKGLDGATEAARQSQLQGTYALVALATNEFKALTTEIGIHLLPVVNAMSNGVKAFMGTIRQWIKENPKLAETLIRVATAGGLIVAGLVTLSGVSMLVSGVLLGQLAGGLGVVASAFGFINTLLFNPLGLIAGFGQVAITAVALVPVFAGVIAIIAAVGLAISDIKNNVGGAGDSFNQLVKTAKAFSSELFGLVGDVGEFLGIFFQLEKTVNPLFLKVKNLIAQITGAGSATTRAFSPVKTVLDSINTFLNNLIDKMKTARAFMNFATGGLMTDERDSSNLANELEQNRLLAERAALQHKLYTGSQQQLSIQIQQGDTLWDIAQKYGTTVDTLMKLNGLDKDTILTIGDKLLIPGQQIAVSNAELRDYQRQIREIDSEIAKLEEPKKLDLSKVRSELLTTKEGVDLLLSGFMTFIRGDIEGGLGKIRGGIDLIKSSVSDMWKAFTNPVGITSNGADFFDQTSLPIGGGGIGGAITGALDAFQFDTAAAARLTGKFETVVNDAIKNISGDNLTLSDITTTLQTGVQTAVDDLNALDTAKIQTWATENLDTISTTIVTVVGIIFGAPFGAVLGIAKLIQTAIENDFLGLGTLLEQSGIKGIVEGAFNDLKTAVENIIKGVFGGGGNSATIGGGAEIFDPTSMIPTTGGAGGNLGAFDKFVNDLKRGVDLLKGIAAGVSGELSAGLQAFGDGVAGFVSGITGAETEGLYDAVRPILGVVGGLITVAISAASFGLSTMLKAIGDALTPLGNAIGLFITTISRIGEGDWSGAFQSFVGGIGQLGLTVLTFPVSIIDSIIEKIEDLTGVELPSIEEGLAGWVGALKNAWLLAGLMLDNIKRTLADWSLSIQLELLRFVGNIRQNVLSASAGTIDIMPDFDVKAGDVRTQIAMRKAGESILGMLQTQIRENGQLDLSESVSFTYTVGDAPVTVQGSLMDALLSPDVLAGMGERGKMLVNDVLTQAFTVGDQQTIDLLTPVAVKMGIDPEAVKTQVESQVETAGAQTTATVEPQVEVNPVMEVAKGLGSAISNFLQGGAGGVFGGLAGLFQTAQTVAPPIDFVGIAAGIDDGLAAALATTPKTETGITNLFDRTNDMFMSQAGIKSPSTVFIEHGTMLVEGLAEGIITNIPKVEEATDLLVNQVNLFAKDLGKQVMLRIGEGMNETVLTALTPPMDLFQQTLLLLQDVGVSAANALAASFEGLAVRLQPLRDAFTDLVNKVDYLYMVTGSPAGNLPNMPTTGFGGGKRFGGDVKSGVLYEVNEDGIAELLQIGRRTFLLPGQNGTVIPPQQYAGADIQAPQVSNSYGGNVTYIYETTIGDVPIHIPPGADSESIKNLVVDTLEEYRQRNPPSLRARNSL